MSNQITDEDIKQIVHLSSLSVNEDKLPVLKSKFEQIIDYVTQIKEIDTENIAPLTHPLTLDQHLREDKVTETVDRSDFLKIAPASEEGFYLVPPVITTHTKDEQS